MKILIISLILVAGGAFAYYAPLHVGSIEYINSPDKNVPTKTEVLPHTSPTAPLSEVVVPITHIPTPVPVKAIYMSSWVAGGAKFRDPLIKLVDETELNSIVIDIKDATGKISYQVSDPELAKEKSWESRIKDIRALTNELHEKNIYVIGRISVFQDPFMTKKRPEWAVKRKSDGLVWKDRKGLSFLDPANQEVWKYIVNIARDSYAQGFDEINFDYIRYPSDGNISEINYHLVDGKSRADNLKAFWNYLHKEVKKDDNIIMSADLFGLTTEVNDDMGIGQVWENALPNFDYLAPMVYPSHYPPGHAGFKNPAAHPYEIINQALAHAIAKTKAVPEQDIKKIRPWLQDFNMGATYTSDLVRAQMKAVYDNKLDSWMLWDPNNRYTKGALELETKP